MASGNRTRVAQRSDVLLAGLQAGILGGLVMLACLMLVSWFYGRSFWSASNLLATTFYGDDALRRGFRWMTVTGVALHLVLTGSVGGLFALAAKPLGDRALVRLVGLLFAVAWYLISFGYLWQHVNPRIPLYSPGAGAMIGSHLVFGLFLGRFPRFLPPRTAEPPE